MEERIQKILARAGYGSRRACEKYLIDGRVKVNGQVAVLGQKADATADHIEVDGRTLPKSEPLVYIAVYKPRNVLSTTSAPDPRPTVVELVNRPERLYPVGRLDIESEGLMLLTNDGEMANRLTHPRFGHEKEYRVLVASRPDDEQLATWRRGVVLEDGYRTQPVRIWMIETLGKGAWLGIVMKEGRKRQIRETGTQLGLPVVKIIRIRIGELHLGSMKTGQWRFLTATEIALLSGAPVVDRPRHSKTDQPVKTQHWELRPEPATKYPSSKSSGGQSHGSSSGKSGSGSTYKGSYSGKPGSSSTYKGSSSGKPGSSSTYKGSSSGKPGSSSTYKGSSSGKPGSSSTYKGSSSGKPGSSSTYKGSSSGKPGSSSTYKGSSSGKPGSSSTYKGTSSGKPGSSAPYKGSSSSSGTSVSGQPYAGPNSGKSGASAGSKSKNNSGRPPAPAKSKKP